MDNFLAVGASNTVSINMAIVGIVGFLMSAIPTNIAEKFTSTHKRILSMVVGVAYLYFLSMQGGIEFGDNLELVLTGLLNGATATGAYAAVKNVLPK